jgi:hypothetical protein
MERKNPSLLAHLKSPMQKIEELALKSIQKALDYEM